MPIVAAQASGTPKLIKRLAALLEEHCHARTKIASCLPVLRAEEEDGVTLRPLESRPRYVAVAVQTDGRLATVLIRTMDESEARDLHNQLAGVLPLLWRQAGEPKRQAEVARRPVFWPVTVNLNERWHQIFQRARVLDSGQGVQGLRQKLVNEFGEYAGEIYSVMIHRRMFGRIAGVTYVNPEVTITIVPALGLTTKGHRRYRSKGYVPPSARVPTPDSDQ